MPLEVTALSFPAFIGKTKKEHDNRELNPFSFEKQNKWPGVPDLINTKLHMLLKNNKY